MAGASAGGVGEGSFAGVEDAAAVGVDDGNGGGRVAVAVGEGAGAPQAVSQINKRAKGRNRFMGQARGRFQSRPPRGAKRKASRKSRVAVSTIAAPEAMPR